METVILYIQSISFPQSRRNAACTQQHYNSVIPCEEAPLYLLLGPFLEVTQQFRKLLIKAAILVHITDKIKSAII